MLQTQGEVISQLEQLGYRVGESLVERVCKDNPRFRTELDAMVFLAKQFWVTLFNKQADHLKTNKQVGELRALQRAVLNCGSAHTSQDMFVLYDNKFRMLVHMSDSAQYKDSAPLVGEADLHRIVITELFFLAS